MLVVWFHYATQERAVLTRTSHTNGRTMLISTWSLLLWGVLLATHAVLAYRLYRLRAATAGDTVEGAGDRVVCPECRTENEPDYSYCRTCVSEFPGCGRGRTVQRRPARRALEVGAGDSTNPFARRAPGL